MKKYLLTTLRAVIAIAGIAYIVYIVQWTDQVDISDPNNPVTQPGIISMVKTADPWLLLLGLVIVGPLYPIQMTRWYVLMRARKIGVSWWQGFRLYMVGNFFNYAMPGATGGDVVKAYYAAKRSHSKADSVMSIIFDRIAGVLGLVIFAGLAGLFMFDNPLARTITIYVWSGFGAGLVMAALYFPANVRKRIGLEWLIRQLPGQKLFQSIDAAAVAYRHHLKAVVVAVLLSIPVHFALALATAMAGYAVGVSAPLGFLLNTLPVVYMAGALPIAPQGVGVMEYAGTTLLADPPAITANHIVTMLVFYRLYQMSYSLLGSVFLLKGDIHLNPQTHDKTSQASE